MEGRPISAATSYGEAYELLVLDPFVACSCETASRTQCRRTLAWYLLLSQALRDVATEIGRPSSQVAWERRVQRMLVPCAQ
jgi:hypothetical protein